MTQPDSSLSGLLLVDKPGLPNHARPQPLPDLLPGDVIVDEAALPARLFTSHDLVQKVRRLARQKRIGHTGTLDPMASGLLVLCLGAATRLVEYYQGHTKQYWAEVTLGVSTDTYDLMGRVTGVAAVPSLASPQIEAALALFRGVGVQRPPAYSALKQEGESLHQKARRGEAIDIPLRPVTFYAIDLLEFLPPATLRLRVVCSAGAYIRSLAVDLGEALGTVAMLSALRREAAGAFALAQAHTLETIESAAAAGGLAHLLLRAGDGLDLPALTIDAESARRLSQGQRLLLPLPAATPDLIREGSDVQALDADGQLLGILRARTAPHDGAAIWQPEKWFG